MALEQTRHKHHVLPEFYLKGFADRKEPKFTWVYTKNKPYNPGKQQYKRYSPCLTSTGIAGSEKDFYANELNDGRMDFDGVERKLEQLEIPSQPIIRKIRNFELISDDDKVVLADYVMHLYKRTKYFRSDPYNRLVAVIDESIDKHKTPEAIQKLSEIHNISIIEAEQALEFYRQKYKGEGKKRIYNEIIFQPFDTMLNGLIDMNWVFLYRKGIRPSPFVTSDAPVYFSRKHGLSRSDMTFPISTDIVLVASWNDVGTGFREAPEFVIKEVNEWTTRLATEHIYASQNAKWISTFANNKIGKER